MTNHPKNVIATITFAKRQFKISLDNHGPNGVDPIRVDRLSQIEITKSAAKHIVVIDDLK